MITIYLIRHGEKEDWTLNAALTKLGLEQANKTASHLKDIEFNAIVSSPQKRTIQTAQIIAAQQSSSFLIDERLKERIEWENKESVEEFLSEWSKTDLDREYLPKNGDSSVKKGSKMYEVINELSQKYQDGNMLLVTHGGSIGDLLRHLFDKKTIPHEIDPVINAPYVKIAECSITVIEKDNRTYRLIKLSDTSHL